MTTKAITATNNGTHEKGVVKWFNAAKGYGFIEREGQGCDIFVHYSGIEGAGYRSLLQDQRVEYDVATTQKGLQAVNVRVAG